MSYYFTILSPTDLPLFSLTFGTSKAGGDGIARFRFPESAKYMNQFVVNASLDMLEEAQWMNGALCVFPASRILFSYIYGGIVI
jgi:trafficking protein particle complex subunit 2